WYARAPSAATARLAISRACASSIINASKVAHPPLLSGAHRSGSGGVGPDPLLPTGAIVGRFQGNRKRKTARQPERHGEKCVPYRQRLLPDVEMVILAPL